MAIVEKIDAMTKERKEAMERIRTKQYADFKKRKQLKDRIDTLAMLIRHQKGYLYIGELH